MKSRIWQLLGFGLIGAILIAGTIIGIQATNTVRNRYRTIVAQDAQHLIELNVMEAAISAVLRESLSASVIAAESEGESGRSALPVNEEAVESEAGERAEAVEAFEAALADYRNTTINTETSTESEETILAIEQNARQIISFSQDLIELKQSGERGAPVIELLEAIEPIEGEFTNEIQTAILATESELATSQALAERSAAISNLLLTSSAVLGLLLIGGMQVVLNRQENRQQQYQAALESINNELLESNSRLTVAEREAREATRMKDSFLSVMSHELRTPLNAILGYQGLMELTGELDDENLNMVQRTQANARRLLVLINDVLDISRIEAGRMDLVPSELRVALLVEQIVSQMEVLADEKNLRLSAIIDQSVPVMVYYDEDALSKIMINLISNAIKFTEKGEVDLRLTASDSQLKIMVSDTGKGIPAHLHEVIFERFRQADSSTTRQHGGSGLGLSIVQQLAQYMGGRVTLQSEVDIGSIFTVELPLQPAPQAENLAI